MYTRGGLLRDAFPLLDQFVKDKGIFGVNLLEEILDDFFLVAGAGGVDPVIAFLEFIAFVEEEGHVAAVIDDQLGSFAVLVEDGLPSAVPIFLEGFPLPGEDGDSGGGNRGGGLILRGEDVAAGPADIGTKIDEGFNQDGRLDGHMEGTGNANAGEGLALGILLADGHQAGHFLLGDFNLFATPVGEGEILDLVVGEILRGFGFWGDGSGAHDGSSCFG